MRAKRVKPRRTKNIILKTITWIAFIGEVLSVCCIDSDSRVPIITAIVCLAWLLLFFKANGE